MLYWFFVKTLSPIARRRFNPTCVGVENIPRTGGAIIAANHLAVIDDAVIPMTSPRMVHFMGKAEYFEGKGIKGRFKKWWFTQAGVFPVDRSGGSKSLGAMETARKIIEDGHVFGIHPEGTRSPDGRLYRGHTGVARLAMETGAPIIPTALIGTRDIQAPGQVMPGKGKVTVIYGTPIEVERREPDAITHEAIRELTDEMMHRIQQMSGQEYVDTYAQVYKKMLKEQGGNPAQAQSEPSQA